MLLNKFCSVLAQCLCRRDSGREVEDSRARKAIIKYTESVFLRVEGEVFLCGLSKLE